jgi:hypothetical protein
LYGFDTGDSLVGAALLHRMRVGIMARYVSAPLTRPALDLKAHFSNRFHVGAFIDCRDRYVSLAIGTRKDERMHVMKPHEQLSVVPRESEDIALEQRRDLLCMPRLTSGGLVSFGLARPREASMAVPMLTMLAPVSKHESSRFFWAFYWAASVND